MYQAPWYKKKLGVWPNGYRLHMFCAQRDIPDINMSSLEDNLQKEDMQIKYKSAKQSSIKSFFTKP